MTDNVRACIRPNPAGDWPDVDPTSFVDPTAQLIGRVTIGPRVFVGPNAVIRADEAGKDGRVEGIVIGAECNVQDGVIIHALGGAPVTIGPRTSVSHGAIVHGPCSLGEGCFVGFGAVVFKSDIAPGVFVAMRAVLEAVSVPADVFVPPLTAHGQDQIDRLRKTDPSERAFMEKVVAANLKLAEGYLNSPSANDATDNRPA